MFCNWQLVTCIDAFELSMIIPLETKPNIKNLRDLFQRKTLNESIDNCKQIMCVCVCVQSVRNKRAIDET